MNPLMHPSDLFTAVMAIAGIGWLALMVFPGRPWANYWLAGVIIPSFLGLTYTALMIIHWFQPPPGQIVNFFSLDGASDLFDNDGLLLAAWTDIVLLSLVAGAWIARRAVQLRIPYALLLPLLLIAFAFPGTAIVLFFVLSAAVGRSRTLEQIERTGPGPTAGG